MRVLILWAATLSFSTFAKDLGQLKIDRIPASAPRAIKKVSLSLNPNKEESLQPRGQIRKGYGTELQNGEVWYPTVLKF